MLMTAARTILVVVDIQDRLIPAVCDGAAVVRNALTLLQAAQILKIPALFTEQYPKGLGHTADELAPFIAPGGRLEKLSFASTGEPEFTASLSASGRDQVVICGIEAHVCVLQTALALRQTGRPVFVIADAIASRTAANKDMAIERLRQAGVVVATTEMAVFEWVAAAGTPEFKQISALVK